VRLTDIEVVEDGRVDSSGTDKQLRSADTKHGANVILTRKLLHTSTQQDKLLIDVFDITHFTSDHHTSSSPLTSFHTNLVRCDWSQPRRTGWAPPWLWPITTRSV